MWADHHGVQKSCSLYVLDVNLSWPICEQVILTRWSSSKGDRMLLYSSPNQIELTWPICEQFTVQFKVYSFSLVNDTVHMIFSLYAREIKLNWAICEQITPRGRCSYSLYDLDIKLSWSMCKPITDKYDTIKRELLFIWPRYSLYELDIKWVQDHRIVGTNSKSLFSDLPMRRSLEEMTSFQSSLSSSPFI